MTQILINGLGRSGTSWMLKVFDQHPRTFSSHEPEKLLPDAQRRALQKAPSFEGSQKFIHDLFACRGLRAMRKRPLVRKAYRSDAAHALRSSYIYGMSAVQPYAPFNVVTRKTPVPDLADLSEATFVSKCVSLEFAMPRIIDDVPDVKFIYLLRHPCGQISSHLKGLKAGKMHQHFLPPRSELDRMFDFDRPVEDYVEDDFTQLEINAYRWATSCDLNVRAAEAHPNGKVLRYEDLCDDPAGVFRKAFEWAGLDWHPRCASFIEASLRTDGDSQGYHDLVRNPRVAANKWRKDMSSEDIETVLRICRHSTAAKYYPDLASSPVRPIRQPGRSQAELIGSPQSRALDKTAL